MDPEEEPENRSAISEPDTLSISSPDLSHHLIDDTAKSPQSVIRDSAVGIASKQSSFRESPVMSSDQKSPRELNERTESSSDDNPSSPALIPLSNVQASTSPVFELHANHHRTVSPDLHSLNTTIFPQANDSNDDTDEETKKLLESFVAEDALARKQYASSQHQSMTSLDSPIHSHATPRSEEVKDHQEEDDYDWREFNTPSDEAAFQRDLQEAMRRSLRDEALLHTPEAILPNPQRTDYRRHPRRRHRHPVNVLHMHQHT